MDVRYINPFVQAVKSVFTTMLSTEVTVGKPSGKAPTEPNADISAIIGLSGDAVGCVTLCFSTSTAIGAASKFAGVEMDERHEDFADALGELANMVAGYAKAKLTGLSCSISLPSVIIGKGHVVTQSKNALRLLLPCDSALGPFAVEVAMVVAKKQAKVASAAG